MVVGSRVFDTTIHYPQTTNRHSRFKPLCKLPICRDVDPDALFVRAGPGVLLSDCPHGAKARLALLLLRRHVAGNPQVSGAGDHKSPDKE